MHFLVRHGKRRQEQEVKNRKHCPGKEKYLLRLFPKYRQQEICPCQKEVNHHCPKDKPLFPVQELMTCSNNIDIF